jgi:hypothetical protein
VTLSARRLVAPTVRAFTIDDGTVDEVPVVVD